MKIGFDLDGVLADLYDLWLAVIAYEYGIKNIIGQSECNQYSIKKVINERCGVNLSRNNMDSALDFIIPQINIVKPFKGAKKILKTVSMSAKNPVIITARLDKYKDCTRAWVDQWLGDYEVFHAASDQKVGVALRLGLNAFVEDKASTAMSMAAAGIKSYLIDRPWNQNIGQREGVVRVNELKDIVGHCWASITN
jgi:uncharacterized HAD superfamily protein